MSPTVQKQWLLHNETRTPRDFRAKVALSESRVCCACRLTGPAPAAPTSRSTYPLPIPDVGNRRVVAGSASTILRKKVVSTSQTIDDRFGPDVPGESSAARSWPLLARLPLVGGESRTIRQSESPAPVTAVEVSSPQRKHSFVDGPHTAGRAALADVRPRWGLDADAEYFSEPVTRISAVLGENRRIDPPPRQSRCEEKRATLGRAAGWQSPPKSSVNYGPLVALIILMLSASFLYWIAFGAGRRSVDGVHQRDQPKQQLIETSVRNSEPIPSSSSVASVTLTPLPSPVVREQDSDQPYPMTRERPFDFTRLGAAPMDSVKR